MLVGYMRVYSADKRQSVDLQRDALVAAGVDKRHLHQDRASGAKDDRRGLKACLADLRHGDVLIFWKRDRLGRSLSHLLAIITDLKKRGVAFRSITEQMDTTTPHGEFLFDVFGSLAQFERALITERVNAGLAAAKRRGRTGGRPRSLDEEQIEQIVAALDGGASKASVCRAFKVPRSTLLNNLDRIGWKGAGVGQGRPQIKTQTALKLTKAKAASRQIPRRASSSISRRGHCGAGCFDGDFGGERPGGFGAIIGESGHSFIGLSFATGSRDLGLFSQTGFVESFGSREALESLRCSRTASTERRLEP